MRQTLLIVPDRSDGFTGLGEAAVRTRHTRALQLILTSRTS
jgi:hypothetical protein